MLSEEQQQALAGFAGLRAEGDGWRRASTAELVATPSPLVDAYLASKRRIEGTAAFLRSLDREEVALSRRATQRATQGTLSRLNTSLRTSRS